MNSVLAKKISLKKALVSSPPWLGNVRHYVRTPRVFNLEKRLCRNFAADQFTSHLTHMSQQYHRFFNQADAMIEAKESAATESTSNLLHPASARHDASIDEKYQHYIQRIFKWSIYRNHSTNAMIRREDMDPALIEMRRLAAYFGNPEKNIRIVHVAGTNGKGSVSLKVARALQRMGLKTGLFTSPHIDTFRERVQVDGVLISKQHVVEHFESILRAIQDE